MEITNDNLLLLLPPPRCEHLIRAIPLQKLVGRVSALLTDILGVGADGWSRKFSDSGDGWHRQSPTHDNVSMAEIPWVGGPENCAILGVGGPKSRMQTPSPQTFLME